MGTSCSAHNHVVYLEVHQVCLQAPAKSWLVTEGIYIFNAMECLEVPS